MPAGEHCEIVTGGMLILVVLSSALIFSPGEAKQTGTGLQCDHEGMNLLHVYNGIYLLQVISDVPAVG